MCQTFIWEQHRITMEVEKTRDKADERVITVLMVITANVLRHASGPVLLHSGRYIYHFNHFKLQHYDHVSELNLIFFYI